MSWVKVEILSGDICLSKHTATSTVHRDWLGDNSIDEMKILFIFSFFSLITFSFNSQLIFYYFFIRKPPKRYYLFVSTVIFPIRKLLSLSLSVIITAAMLHCIDQVDVYLIIKSLNNYICFVISLLHLN